MKTNRGKCAQEKGREGERASEQNAITSVRQERMNIRVSISWRTQNGAGHCLFPLHIFRLVASYGKKRPPEIERVRAGRTDGAYSGDNTRALCLVTTEASPSFQKPNPKLRQNFGLTFSLILFKNLNGSKKRSQPICRTDEGLGLQFPRIPPAPLARSQLLSWHLTGFGSTGNIIPHAVCIYCRTINGDGERERDGAYA